MKISVIVVCYNAAKKIRVALDSIQKNRDSTTELIVIDGSSRDNTLAIVDEYGELVTKLVSEPDKGIYHAMNKGLRLATGDWVVFLGADDKLVTSIGRIKKFLVDPACVYYGDAFFSEANILYGGPYNKLKIFYSNVCHQAVFYPKLIYKSHFYDIKYSIRADHAYNMKVFCCQKTQYLPIKVAVYDDTGISSQDPDELFQKDRLKIYKEVAPFYLYFLVCIRFHFSKLLRKLKLK